MTRVTPSVFLRDSYGYPTSDGKPMAETEVHRNLMMELIWSLSEYYADDPNVCVTGNLLLYYTQGDKRRHVSPDVFFVRGIPKGIRPNYLTWIEGKGPDVVVELTSKSTRKEDTGRKFDLYRDVLCVPEYFLFDPQGDYLEPRFQGYRLLDDEYQPIDSVDGRLPSIVLGLHLEEAGEELRVWDPQTAHWLPTRAEKDAMAALHAQQNELLREELQEAALGRRQDAEARRRAEQQAELLRREIEDLRRRLNTPPAEQP